MIEDWIVVTCGVVAIVIVMAVTLLKLRSTERRMHESTHKLKVDRQNTDATYGVLPSCEQDWREDVSACRTGTS